VAEHRSAYLIKYTGLPLGDHEYDYEIGNSFFEGRASSIIKKAQVKAKAVLRKGPTMQLDLKLEGIIWVECMRCLEEMTLAVNVERSLLIRLVENVSAEEDDVDSISLPANAHEIDMAIHLYDFLTLEVPFSPVHPDNEQGIPECNPEVLKHIASQKEADKLNPANDRWAALRKLKMN